MPPEYELLYNDLLRDISHMQEKADCDKEAAESCFWIASNYWNRLKKLTGETGFASEEEEIRFFREVKPMFLRHAKYFILISESILFVPDTALAARAYWLEEGRRLERFCSRHFVFIQYYKSGSQDHDQLYFLRRTYAGRKLVPPYDDDPAWCCQQDGTLCSYLAHQLYFQFTQDKLKALAAG